MGSKKVGIQIPHRRYARSTTSWCGVKIPGGNDEQTTKLLLETLNGIEAPHAARPEAGRTVRTNGELQSPAEPVVNGELHVGWNESCWGRKFWKRVWDTDKNVPG